MLQAPYILKQFFCHGKKNFESDELYLQFFPLHAIQDSLPAETTKLPFTQFCHFKGKESNIVSYHHDHLQDASYQRDHILLYLYSLLTMVPSKTVKASENVHCIQQSFCLLKCEATFMARVHRYFAFVRMKRLISLYMIKSFSPHMREDLKQ